MEPSPEQIERGAEVLVPFVREWNLPLNPEDLVDMAYAVLRYHDTEASWEEVEVEVRAQIARADQDKRELAELYRERSDARAAERARDLGEDR